jgi:hypothetical protein
VTCSEREIGGRENGEHVSSLKKVPDEEVGTKMQGSNF